MTLSTLYTIPSLVFLQIINGSTVSVSKENSYNDFSESEQFIERKADDVMQTCEKRYKDLEKKLHSQISRRAGPGSIAFSAQLSGQQPHISIGTTIKFNKVFVNDRSGYNHQTGVFIAPEAGVYIFSYFIGNGYKSGQVWVGLMHNGQRINSAVTDAFHINEDLQGGNTALLRMNAGDRAWIGSYHQSNVYLDGHNGFTSFSGVYLYY